MVERTVLECFGGGTVAVSHTHLATEGEGRLASSLERHAGLQRSAGVRVFFKMEGQCTMVNTTRETVRCSRTHSGCR